MKPCYFCKYDESWIYCKRCQNPVCSDCCFLINNDNPSNNFCKDCFSYDNDIFDNEIENDDNFNYNNLEHIYIIKEREFIKTKESIFKVGRTKNIIKRMNSYPKSSQILYVEYYDNSKNIEAMIIKILKIFFDQRKDIGREYFEGNPSEMINIIRKYIRN